MTTRSDISATCVTQGACPWRHTVCRGQAAVYDEVGGGYRHAGCAPCVPMPKCGNCGHSHMAHIRTWTGLLCPAGSSNYAHEPTSVNALQGPDGD